MNNWESEQAQNDIQDRHCEEGSVPVLKQRMRMDAQDVDIVERLNFWEGEYHYPSGLLSEAAKKITSLRDLADKHHTACVVAENALAQQSALVEEWKEQHARAVQHYEEVLAMVKKVVELEENDGA